MGRVEHLAAFRADLQRQIRYLRERADEDRVQALRTELADATRLLARFPDAGTELSRDHARVIRRLPLRRAPFYVLYAREAARPDAVLCLRLFHVRQRAP